MKLLYNHYSSRSGLGFARNDENGRHDTRPQGTWQSRNRIFQVSWVYLFFIVLGGIFITKPVTAALNIHEITTPKGIKAWFVEDQSLPVISFSFAFEGGSANVPLGQEGIAPFAAQLLLEGADDLTAHDFKEKIEELGIQMNFTVDKDYFYGTLRTIVDHQQDAFKLLKSALLLPRLDDSSIEIVRDRLITNVRNLQKDPTHVVSQKMREVLFKNQPYGRPEDGTVQSLKAIKKEDIKKFLTQEFRRDGLRIVICGNLALSVVPEIIDNIFGDFLAPVEIKKLQEITIKFPGTIFIEKRPFPQSVCIFLQQGLNPHDPNFAKLALLSNILGGKTSSRLWNKVREERGLAYYIGTTLDVNRYAQFLSGVVGSENARIKDAITIIRSEWQKAAKGNFTEKELNHSKEALVESIALALADTMNTTKFLLHYFLDGFTPQYIYDREKRIRSVSLEQLNTFAQTFIEPNQLTFFIAGTPAGLKEANGQ